MASRRAATQVVRAASRLLHQRAPRSATAGFFSQAAFLPRRAAVASAASVRLPSLRAYSQQAASGQESKIWSFEDMQRLSQEARSDVTIVDVREPGELQQTGHIPRAVNIPITSSPDSFHIADEEFEDRFGFPRPPKDAEVVFYCKAGVRSRGAAGLARDAGWQKVGEYPGSWSEWFERNGKVER